LEYIFQILVLYYYVPQKPLRLFKHVWRFYLFKSFCWWGSKNL